MARCAGIYFLTMVGLVLTVKLALYAQSASRVDGLYRSTDFEVHRGWKAITAQADFPWLQDEKDAVGLPAAPAVTPQAPTRWPVSSPTARMLFGPLRFWYREDTSLWTLDYPMLFAYVECALAFLARSPMSVHIFFGGNASAVEAALSVPPRQRRDGSVRRLDPDVAFVSQGIIDFQRMTVILFSDIPFMLCLAAAAPRLLSSFVGASIVAWVALHPGHVIIDNIHFQYNGLFFAVFVVIVLLARQRRPVAAAGVFVTLVLLKHLFLYYVLGFGVWGLASLVVEPSPLHRMKLIIGVLAVTCLVLVASLAPFVLSEAQFLYCRQVPLQCSGEIDTLSLLQGMMSTAIGPDLLRRAIVGTIEPIRRRLFPFGRGLVHAYWAPNAFALYSALDLALCRLSSFKWSPVGAWVPPGRLQQCGNTSVNTRGLVGLTDEHVSSAPTHAILAHVTPTASFICVVACFFFLLLVILSRAWKKHRSRRKLCLWLSSGDGLLTLTFCSSAAFFMFSWHVHEKAWLTVLLPQAILALQSVEIQKSQVSGSPFFDIYAVNVLLTVPSLLPLLHSPRENLIKYALYFVSIATYFRISGTGRKGGFSKGHLLFTCVSLVVSVGVDCKPETFLFLMIMSCFQSLAVVYTLVRAARYLPL
jgi:alpha-1,3-glucosyltransferase